MNKNFFDGKFYVFDSISGLNHKEEIRTLMEMKNRGRNTMAEIDEH